jgi:hypothetical protein
MSDNSRNRRSPFDIVLPEDLQDSQLRRRPAGLADILYVPRSNQRPPEETPNDEQKDTI